MNRILEFHTAVVIFGVTLLAQGAIILAVIAILGGVSSLFMLIRKIDELNEIAHKQVEAVEKLDGLVTRIEDAVNTKEC